MRGTPSTAFADVRRSERPPAVGTLHRCATYLPSRTSRRANTIVSPSGDTSNPVRACCFETMSGPMRGVGTSVSSRLDVRYPITTGIDRSPHRREQLGTGDVLGKGPDLAVLAVRIVAVEVLDRVVDPARLFVELDRVRVDHLPDHLLTLSVLAPDLDVRVRASDGRRPERD